MNDFDNGRIRLMQGDCLERMKEIPDQSIDLILTDPPYGITGMKWDSMIPLDNMWKELNRIIKDNGNIVLFASQPFSSLLVSSNIDQFKYEWIWKKNKYTGGFHSNKQPFRSCEHILIFARKILYYYPQKIKRTASEFKKVYRSNATIQGNSPFYNNEGKKIKERKSIEDQWYRLPDNLLQFNVDDTRKKNKFHPTQKPVALLEYLIQTYTQEDEVVLDFTYGSCSTGIAAVNTNRRFIGIELDEHYYQLGLARVQNHLDELAGRML